MSQPRPQPATRRTEDLDRNLALELVRVTEAAASVAEFPVDSFRNPRTLHHMRAFARWCRQTRVSIVHTTELYSNIFGLPAAAMGRVPVRIGNRREINPDKRPAQIALQRAAYACAHKVVANSRAAACESPAPSSLPRTTISLLSMRRGSSASSAR